jgi:transketolase
MEGFPFFDAATGSLGQGLSVAAGWRGGAARRAGQAGLLHHRRRGGREGQIAEALDFIVDAG